MEPETINGIQDEDGCPDRGDSLVVLSPDRLELLDAIPFRGDKPTKAANNLLGQIGATLRAHTEIVRIRVTVHVQPSDNTDRDQATSDARAKAVRDWIVGYGIDPKRVEARGFGGTKPLVPREQKGSKDLNERVELIIPRAALNRKRYTRACLMWTHRRRSSGIEAWRNRMSA